MKYLSSSASEEGNARDSKIGSVQGSQDNMGKALHPA